MKIKNGDPGNPNEVYAEFYKNSHTDGCYAAYIRGWRCKTETDFLREYSSAFQFPDYFGNNWNAWDECAADLDWLSFTSLALVIDHYELMFCKEKDVADSLAVFERRITKLKEYWEIEEKVPFEIVAFKYDKKSKIHFIL